MTRKNGGYDRPNAQSMLVTAKDETHFYYSAKGNAIIHAQQPNDKHAI